jgi:anti-anti-sigma regulatory factor
MATQTQQGSVRVYQQGPTLTFQVIGWARMHQSMPVRRLCEKGMGDGVSIVQVDLRHCSYIDSTFLGTLLLLRRNLPRRNGCRFQLISPSPECCRLFKQMGVDECLTAVSADELPGDVWTELCCEPDNVEAFNRNVVQAHQELANIGGPAGKAFEGVARCLTKDLEAGDIP